MWNRVVLLLAGVAVGWNLCNYWVVAGDQARTQLVRVALGTAAGLGMALWLGLELPEAGHIALGVFLVGAGSAYAANARQVSRVEEPLLGAQPQTPPATRAGRCLLLVLPGEPPRYDGPTFWARAMQAHEQAGGAVPHWLVRPPTYARIRAAYARLAAENPAHALLAREAEALAARLGEDHTGTYACLHSAPLLLPTLVRLAEEGWTRLVLLPVGFADDPTEAIRRQVTRSRVREVGVDVRYAPPLPLAAWDPLPLAERLPALMAGQPPPAPYPARADALDELARRAREA